MKASLNLLKTLVNLEGLSPLEIANGLTSAGIEVEQILPLASATGLVIGQIKTVEMHPDSDHLHILNVDLGSRYGVKQIVCGAPNVKVGLKVIVCLPGSVLPGGTIKEGVIRGVSSYGMCASLLELGVDKALLTPKQLEGIEELDDDAPVGEEKVLEYLGLDDVSFELSILPNRPDALSLLGLARELATIFKRELYPLEEGVKGTFKSKYIPLSETKKCDQFYLREVRGIKNGPSPKWLSSRLLACGIRSLNKVVDIGNYVMLLTGRPFNMYDASKVEGDKLIAKEGYTGSWVAMDDNSYELIASDIGICDSKDIACLAGVFTSKKAMCVDSSSDILIEVASFDSTSIRKTANRLALNSDSSTRFVRGIDKSAAEYSIALASKLLVELCDAKEVSVSNIYQESELKEVEIKSSYSYINTRLGTSLSNEEIKEVLTRDHLKIVDKGDTFTATVPSFRLDIKGEEDLSEEVIRLYGYDAIKGSFPIVSMAMGGLNAYQTKRKLIREYLLNRGLYEALTYTLIDAKEVGLFNYLSENEEAYELTHPLTPERSVVRTSLLYSLLKSVIYNINHQNKDFAMFEVSDVDSKTKEGERLAIIGYGKEHLEDEFVTRPYNFYYLKGLLEGITKILGINPSRVRYQELKSDKEELHPYASAEVYVGNIKVAVLGEAHPNASVKYGLKEKTALMEIDLKALLNVPTGLVKAKAPSKFPTSTRDYSLLLPVSLAYAKLKEAIKKSNNLVKEVAIFDTYQAKDTPMGYKTLAIRVYLSDETKTLTDSDMQVAHEKILGAIKNLKGEIKGE